LEALFADAEAWCYTTLSRGDALEQTGWQEPIRASA
jgi:hypothetical protein